jgi:hypothetical protein
MSARLALIRPLRGHLLPQAGEGVAGDCTNFLNLDEGRSAPPLPLAGEGWGEGEPQHSIIATTKYVGDANA